MQLYRRVFELPGITGGHHSPIHESFAVDLLLEGCARERVSILLGHKSINVTEKHYAPWIRSRQEQLEAFGAFGTNTRNCSPG